MLVCLCSNHIWEIESVANLRLVGEGDNAQAVARVEGGTDCMGSMLDKIEHGEAEVLALRARPNRSLRSG
jgi:hypothetical protein